MAEKKETRKKEVVKGVEMKVEREDKKTEDGPRKETGKEVVKNDAPAKEAAAGGKDGDTGKKGSAGNDRAEENVGKGNNTDEDGGDGGAVGKAAPAGDGDASTKKDSGKKATRVKARNIGLNGTKHTGGIKATTRNSSIATTRQPRAAAKTGSLRDEYSPTTKAAIEEAEAMMNQPTPDKDSVSLASDEEVHRTVEEVPKEDRGQVRSSGEDPESGLDEIPRKEAKSDDDDDDGNDDANEALAVAAKGTKGSKTGGPGGKAEVGEGKPGSPPAAGACYGTNYTLEAEKGVVEKRKKDAATRHAPRVRATLHKNEKPKRSKSDVEPPAAGGAMSPTQMTRSFIQFFNHSVRLSHDYTAFLRFHHGDWMADEAERELNQAFKRKHSKDEGKQREDELKEKKAKNQK